MVLVMLSIAEKNLSFRPKHKLRVVSINFNRHRFHLIFCTSQFLLVLSVGELPSLSLDAPQESGLVRAFVIAQADFRLNVASLMHWTFLVERVDKVFDKHVAIGVDCFLLAGVHVTELFKLLTFSVFLMLRVDRLNVNLLHP